MKYPSDHGPVAPEGFQLVRIDFGDVNTPMSKRTYVQVKAGYGEGARALRARGGLPNFRKVINRIKKQIKTGRRANIVLPPLSRATRAYLNQMVGRKS